MRNCPVCNLEILSKRNKFCSKKCSDLSQVKKPQLRTCIGCKKDYLIKYANLSRPRLYCSLQCRTSCPIYHAKLSKACTGKSGGWRNFGGNGIKGIYEGFTYQSSWELIWIKYHIQKSIPFRRCEEYFEYEFKNKIRKYYPDFFLTEEKRYVEVKGFVNEQVKAKLAVVPNILLVMKDEINKMKLELCEGVEPSPIDWKSMILPLN